MYTVLPTRTVLPSGERFTLRSFVLIAVVPRVPFQAVAPSLAVGFECLTLRMAGKENNLDIKFENVPTCKV